MEESGTEKKKAFQLNTLETDFRAETIAAGQISSGRQSDKVLLVRRQGDKRNVYKDIDKLETEYSGYDLLEYLYIYTNRKSIYDTLPEGVVHQPESNRKQRYREDIIREIKSHRQEEFHARRFFRPFEMAVDSLLIHAQEYEQHFDKAFFYDNLRSIFENHWDILRYMNVRQALLYIRIIPVIPEVSSSLELMSKVMGIILECRVTIKEGRKSVHELDPADRVPLGKWNLGINSVLGKKAESDDFDLDITIGPIGYEKMRRFKTDDVSGKVLIKLADKLIPFDRYYNIGYKVIKSDTAFRLSDETHTAYLGINTTLQ